MPLDTFSQEVLRIAAAAQRVAYGEGRSNTRAFMDALGQSGWSALTGPDVDPRGFYIFDNAAAFAMVSGNTVVIGIRGSATEGDSSIDWAITQDWVSAAADPVGYYENIESFIQNVLDYAGPNRQIVLVGHSLGGQAALVTAALQIQQRINQGTLQAENVSIVTFGAPGVPLSIDQGISAQLESRILSFVNSDDWVPLDSVAGFTQYYPGTRLTFHVLDDSGVGEGFDSSDNDAGGIVHSQSLYYQVVTDLAYAEWYSAWDPSNGGLYALHSDFYANPNDNFLLTLSQVSGAVLGLTGNDTITRPAGQPGTVFISGGVGDDTIYGSDNGVDYIDGGSGVDSITSRGGNDFLWGGSGADTLEGGAGTDVLRGGADGDTLIGEAGSDTLYGDGGNDTAVFERAFSLANYRIYQSGSFIVVEDRQSGDIDRLNLVEFIQFGAVTDSIDDWLNAANPPPTQPPPTVPPPTTPPPPPSQGDDFGNSIATAHTISNNTAFAGVIGVLGDQDWFAVTLQAGFEYGFSMAGGSYGGISGLASPHLYLVNAAGEIIAHGAPVSTNSIFEFVPSTSGVYYLQASAHAGQGTGAYGLAVTPHGPAGEPPSGPVHLVLDDIVDVIAEDDGQLIFHVEYSGDLTEDIVIGWYLEDSGDDPIEANDVAHMSGQVTLQSHDDDGYVTIRIDPQDDHVDEGDEQFRINIYIISGEATIDDDDARATILNDDAGSIHPDIDEHGNSFAGATAIVHNTWYRGFVTTQGDVDFFAVTLVGGTTYDIIALGDNDTSLIGGTETGFINLDDPHVSFYDANFNLISQYTAPVNSDRAVYQFTPGDTGLFYIAVREVGDNDIGQYFVNADIRIPADDFAANMTTTAVLAEGELGIVFVERPDDEDWVRVDLDAGATYSFFAVAEQNQNSSTYTWPATFSEVELRLFDANGQLVASFAPGAVSTQSNQLTFTAALSGDYFLSVRERPTGSSTGEFIVGYDAIAPQPATTPIIVQPGPADGLDLYFLQVRDAGSTDPGVDAGLLHIGGQNQSPGSSGSALRFDLDTLPDEAQAAYVEIYLSDAVWNGNGGFAPSTMVLAAASQVWTEASALTDLGPHLFQSWLSAPTGPGWYRIDVTSLYNQWQNGSLANNGLLLLPVDLSTVTNLFFSSDHVDPALRPRLIVYERAPGEILGTNALESLIGTPQADSIVALGGDDVISADAGADIVEGGAGADFINGGDGYDAASYANSPVAVQVDLAQNEASGGHAAGDSLLNVERLIGSDFGDTLIGDAGENSLRGEGGNDRLSGGGGADQIDGGGGVDTADYSADANGVVVNLQTGTATDGGLSTDALSLIENVIGSEFDDTLIGAAGANGLTGSGGADVLDGGLGADIMSGGDGNDTYVVDNAGDVTSETSALGGVDTMQSSITHTLGANLENMTLTGSASINGTGNELANTLTGNTGANTLNGGDGDDTLIGGLGLDTVNGGNGADTFVYAMGDGNGAINGGLDSDTLNLSDGAAGSILNASYDGAALTALSGNSLTSVETINANMGGGVDWLIYSAAAAVTVNLAAGSASGFSSIAGIERVVGGAGNDGLTGDGLDNRLDGGAGDDTLAGAGGVDTLIGGDGGDTLTGGLANDSLQGNAGNDSFNWAVGDGRDTIDGGADFDTFNAAGTAGVELGQASWNGTSLTALMDNGLANLEAVNLDLGGAIDWLIYNTTFAVIVNLATNSASGFASVTNIEKVIGGSGDDSLTGDGLDNRLDGQGGADTLDGGAGADTVLGGDGNDTIYASASNDSLQGQNGNDTFIWVATDGRDTFNGGADSDTVNLTGSAVADVADANWNGAVITGLLNNALIEIETVNIDLGDGGAGGDWLRYNTTFGITVDLGAGAGTGFASITGVENLIGGTGNDSLTGDAGANKINGNNGDDVISGGGGADNLTGGVGSDTFVYAAGAGNDTINDFDAWAAGGQDFLDVAAFGINAGNFAARVAIIDTGADTVIRIDDAYFITLKNVSGDGDNSITQADFIFGP